MTEVMGFLFHRGGLRIYAETRSGPLSIRRVFGRFSPYLKSTLEYVPRGVHIPVEDKPTHGASVHPLTQALLHPPAAARADLTGIPRVDPKDAREASKGPMLYSLSTVAFGFVFRIRFLLIKFK
jgi:hypothetical protein